jgi:hypothetical protein
MIELPTGRTGERDEVEHKKSNGARFRRQDHGGESRRPKRFYHEAMTLVVSAFAPVDRRRFGDPASRSGRLQDAERYRGSAHVLPTPRRRGNMLAHAGPAAQEVSELVVAAAIPPR